MTDKQIKEEIKHINTRNQEYIAENNKMTKKIIDGVDVSGCIFFEIDYLEDEDVKIKEFCRIIHCDCDSNPNCYYKQLKRKEQECEELNKTLIEINEIAEGMHDLWINKTKYTDIDNLVKHLLECELNRIIYKLDEISEYEVKNEN